MDRFTTLYKQQSATAKEIDNKTLQYNSAKSQLEEARQMRNEINALISYTYLTAPFSGIVTQKIMDAGNMATPGMPILTIEQNGNFQVSASVPENQISKVKQGVAAIIVINASGKVIKGAVTQISQSSTFTGGQYIVKINIPDNEKEGLLAGMYADLAIPFKNTASKKDDESQVLVPVSCIEHRDQLNGLYTIGNNNTALLRWVTLGKVEGDQVEVLSGLAPHEQFIASADGRLFNGALVKIKN
jgi:RND family efflux transporter MFP subunit